MRRNDNLTDKLANLKKELNDLKTAQASGSDTIVTYENKTADAVDFTYLLANMGAGISRWVKFSADNQDYPLIKVACDLKYKTSGLTPDYSTVWIQMYPLPSRPAKEVVYYLYARIPSLSPPPEVLTPGIMTDDIDIKAYVYATDTGSVTIHSSEP